MPNRSTALCLSVRMCETHFYLRYTKINIVQLTLHFEKVTRLANFITTVTRAYLSHLRFISSQAIRYNI